MYELVQVSEKCYYINCPAKIGVYVAVRWYNKVVTPNRK